MLIIVRKLLNIELNSLQDFVKNCIFYVMKVSIVVGVDGDGLSNKRR